MNTQSRVLLPERLWKEALDKEHLDRLILSYMQRYPNYEVKSVKGKFALCVRKEGGMMMDG